MFKKTSKPIVFAGPSLSLVPGELLATLDVRPPAKRGDLAELLECTSAGTVVLIDGLFSQSLAPTPTECRKLLGAGWRVIGAASMGALRAAELWSIGMIGIGEVYTQFRLSRLCRDAEVAVCFNPRNWTECTLSLVHVRSVLSELTLRQAIGSLEARTAFVVARRLHYTERTEEVCRCEWTNAAIRPMTISIICDYLRNPLFHPKTLDGLATISALKTNFWPYRNSSQRYRQNTKTCKACSCKLPEDAIFCPNCASSSHELAH